jgi:hypothetical protein
MPQAQRTSASWVIGRIVAIVTLPFRLLMALTKATLATACIALLVVSLALPVLTTTWLAMFSVAATLAEAITSVPSLLKRQERSAVARLAEKEALLAAERAAKKTAQTAATELGANLDKSMARVVIAERRAADLTAKLAIKEAALAELAGAKVLYRGEQRAMKEVVTDAAQRVGARTTKIIKADISGMVGQAIPYVGAVAVVAITAYDLDQSCELMKDLHALDVAFNPDHAIDAREVCGMQVPTVDEILKKAKAAPGNAIDAIMGAIPEFQWDAGLKDLRHSLPEFHWKQGMADLGEYLPDFHWTEGWNDLFGGDQR